MMTELLFAILAPIALIDSLSIIPVCLIPLIILLTSQRPVVNTAMFIIGIFVVYFPFGLLLVFGLSAVFDTVGEWISEWLNRKPEFIDLVAQFLIGIALLSLGRLIARKRVSKTTEQPVLVVTPMISFNFSALLMLSGLWGALPYFAAVEQIVRAEITALNIVLSLAFYNVVFVTPLVVLFITGLALGSGAKRFLEKITEFVTRFGRQFIAIVLILLGLLLVLDAVGWYFNHPIIPIGD